MMRINRVQLLEDIRFWTGLVVTMTTPFLVIVLGLNFWLSYACDQYQEVTGVETRWVFMGSCYLKTDYGWLTQKQYAATLIAREGLSK